MEPTIYLYNDIEELTEDNYEYNDSYDDYDNDDGDNDGDDENTIDDLW